MPRRAHRLAAIVLVATALLAANAHAGTAARQPNPLLEGFDDTAAITQAYNAQGWVRHDARGHRMVFGGPGWFATKRGFSNHLYVVGRVYVPSAVDTRVDEVGLLLRQGGHRLNVNIVYGREHPAAGQLVIARDGTIVMSTPIDVRRGAWHQLRLYANGLRLMAKAWPARTREPAGAQLSYPLDAQWRASGGIGFAHSGRGTVVDDLGIYDFGQIDVRDALRAMLPRPILDDRPGFVAMYWKAWELAQAHIRVGTPQNGFAAAYLDEGSAPSLYQWDTCFTALFAIYAQGAVPGIESLDNFYRRQHADGFICREISRADGTDVHPDYSDQSINPPLFAWAEWRYYRHTGDASRLARVLPVLMGYYNWIDAHRRGPYGLLVQSCAGAGMDNSPRHGAAWIDLSAQQAQAALILSWIGTQVHNADIQTTYADEYTRLRDAIDEHLWSEDDGFYYDLDENDELVPVKTIAAFWPLLAQVPTAERADALVRHLKRPAEFLRDHRIPSLSADDPDFNPEGDYYLGGVWPPLDYMVIKGLELYGYQDDARLIALNHLTTMNTVFKDTGTLWQYYAPDEAEPGLKAQRDFVGWSALGPIALLIENVIGLQTDGANDALVWRLREPGRHGIENLRFGDNTVSLVCERAAGPDAPRAVTVVSNSRFILTIDTPAGPLVKTIPPGTTTFNVRTTQ